MSEETQNKFTPEEEQLLDIMSKILRKDNERKYIENTVAKKIASSNFSAPAQHGFFASSAVKIFATAGFAIVALLVIYFIYNLSTDKSTLNEPEPYKLNTTFDRLHKERQLPNKIDEQKSAQTQTNETNSTKSQRSKNALPGLPLASKNKSINSTKKNVQEYSFTQVYKFSENANIKNFRRDLMNELKKLNIKFFDKSNINEVVYLVSEKTDGVNDESQAVDFYIIATVHRNFPGNLNLSLRYSFADNTATIGTANSINKLFYNNIQARITNLINWRYKP